MFAVFSQNLEKAPTSAFSLLKAPSIQYCFHTVESIAALNNEMA